MYDTFRIGFFMSSTLYRKYRPQRFSEVVDQNHIKITLQNELKLGRPVHAYIFSGPRGVGKTTLARIFAKSLNCQNRKEGEVEPCGTCTPCLEIAGGRHIDVIEIDAASHTGVDNVRVNVIENARFVPQMGAYKVFIIDEVHMLSTSAFNALLKTLEEPPSQVVFILATTELHKVPETIVSRCQRFDFRTIDREHLVKRLGYIAQEEGFEVEPEVLNLIAARSGGYLRDAESTLGQLLALGEQKIGLDQAWFVLPRGNFESVRLLIGDVYSGDAKSCVEHVLTLAEEGADMKVFLGDVIKALRELYLYQAAGMRTLGFEEYFGSDAPRISVLLQNRGIDFTLRFVEQCLKVHEFFRTAVPEHIVVELAFLQTIESSKLPAFISEQRRSGTEMGAGGKKDDSRASTISLSHEHVMERWDQVVKESAGVNHSIKLILGSVRPLDVINGWFRLELGYDLHAQKLSDPKTRGLIESVLEKVYGHTLKLKVEKNESLKEQKPQESQSQELVDDLMKNFGGKIE